MSPGTRTVRAMILLGLSGIAVAVFPELAPLLGVVLVAIIVAAALELSELRHVQVRIDRPPAIAFSLGEVERYTMALSTSASFPVEIQLHQPWPDLVDERSTTRLGICRPGEVLRFDFQVKAIERGVAELPAPFLRITRRRLAERTMQAGTAAQIAVTPNTAAVSRLHKQLNQFFLRGYGSRTAASLGKGREFDRMRNYVRGDELRDVAWKTTARHARLIVREYRLDRSQDILICVDTGHRMAARIGHISRVDHAVNATMLLSYVCNRMEDRIGVLAFSSQVEEAVPPNRGMAHLLRITRFATKVHPFYRHTDYLALAADLRHRVRHRSLIFLMTVLPEQEEHRDLLRAVRMLAPQHLVLITVFADVQLKAVSEMLPADKHELARTIVARDLWDSRAALTRQLRALGALVVDSPPDVFSTESVNAYLDVKRRQLL